MPLNEQFPQDGASVSLTSTKVSDAFRIKSVIDWDEHFFEEVKQFKPDGTIRSIELVNLPSILPYFNEIEVSANVNQVLHYLAKMNLAPNAGGWSHVGTPIASEDPQNKGKRYQVDIKRGKVILEIKRPAVLRSGKVSNFARELNDLNTQINRDIVQQLATYLHSKGLKFGVITSYEWWWFAYLDTESQVLYLTSAQSWKAGGEDSYSPSVYQCLATLFHLAERQQ
jgi:hypothetical protein